MIMKRILAVILSIAMLCSMMASCIFDTEDTGKTTDPTSSTTQPGETPVCKEHTDADEDYFCDICGLALEKQEEPPVDDECKEHADADGNYICDKCGAELEKQEEPPVDDECKEHADADGNYICDKCGAELEKPEDPFEKPEQPDPEITGTIEVTLTGYSFETVYCEWKPLENADSYNVYCNGVKVDGELTRFYGSYYRCDVLGLKAGEYTVDIIPVLNGEEVSSAKTSFKKATIAHVREGFGFVGGSASGAYNDDGTLKKGAQVIYVTSKNAKTVTANVNGAIQTGLQTILDAKQKANTSGDILCIRIIGMLSASDMDHFSSSSEGLQIKGRAAYTDMNITIEGVGNDATVNGFGFLLRNCRNVEIRNLGIMNFMDDGISIDTDNRNLWLHNIDFFYGQAGSDSDQNKGDGSLDIKKSQYITVSYNHFFESGKACLLDASTGSNADYISYHHNWFDHSDSRHPRVRNANVHVYNNYYDGVAKYGIGAAGGGSSVFSEANYFENTKYPMLTSMQGSDIAGDGEGTFSGEDGGVIKSFGDVIIGGTFVPYSATNRVEYDAYVASARDEVIPSSIASKKGGHTYSNFDTGADMYDYRVQTAVDAKANVMEFAGRVQGGDFKWTFNDADDASFEINKALAAALAAYKCKLVSVGSGSGNSSGTEGGDNGGNGESGGNETPVTPTPEGTIVHNFHTDGMTSSFFVISGHLSTSKGTITYDGKELTQCLKLESSTSITFTLTEARTLTLVFNPTASVKVDGEEYSSDTNVITLELGAGAHTITKDKSTNLYYIVLE